MEGDEATLKKKRRVKKKKDPRQQMYKRLGLDLYPLTNHNTMTGQKGSGKTTLAMLYLFRYLASGRVVFTNFRLYGGWFLAAARIAAGGPEAFDALPEPSKTYVYRRRQGPELNPTTSDRAPSSTLTPTRWRRQRDGADSGDVRRPMTFSRSVGAAPDQQRTRGAAP